MYHVAHSYRECMCVHVCICMYMCVYAWTCVYMCVYAWTCVYMCVYAWTCVYMCVHVCICMDMCVHVCTCVYMHGHVCTCMYMHGHVCTCMYMHGHVCTSFLVPFKEVVFCCVTRSRSVKRNTTTSLGGRCLLSKSFSGPLCTSCLSLEASTPGSSCCDN